jgi:hypothetical protein
VVVDEAMFVDSRSTNENAPQSTGTYDPYNHTNTRLAEIDMEEISTVGMDEGLPF